jgi:hypothetical protein
MRPKHIIALIAGLVPALASAEIVSRTYGLGNVHEPMAACGSNGCQILNLVGSHNGNRVCAQGVPGSEDMFLFEGNPPVRVFPCVTQGPDELLSSVLQIQSDAALGADPVPGRITVEECVGSSCGAGFPVGAVRIPANSISGFHNRVTLNLEIFGDTFIIPSAIRFRFDGATGTGSPTSQIVWNNPVPYILEGCLICVSGSGSGCAALGLVNVASGIEGDPVCNGDVQPFDPRLRDMPNWISDDAGDTWHFPSNEDGFYSSTYTSTPGEPANAPLESIYSDDIDRSADTGRENGGAWILRGFLGRECGTMNMPSPDAFIPSAGKPDPDCDGSADWRYGTGNFTEPQCLDNGVTAVFAPADGGNTAGCESLAPSGTAASPDTFISSFLTDTRDPSHPVWATRATIDVEEDPSGNPGDIKWCTGTSLVCPDDAACRDCVGGLCSASGAECLVDADCFDSSCSEVGTVTVPAGSLSGATVSHTLNIDLGADALTIMASTRSLMDGATGLGSPGDVVVWNNPVPWDPTAGSCYHCVSDSGNGCTTLAGLVEGVTTCNQAAAGDPLTRAMPSWVSTDLGRTWRFSRTNGDEDDDNAGSWEAGTESIASSPVAGNPQPMVLFGFRDHDCGTMNSPSRGLATGNPGNPPHARVDLDCDRQVDPGVYPLVAKAGDPEFPGFVPLPADLASDPCVSALDKCCGDQSGDGDVTVSDLTAINTAVFVPTLATQLCDANNDSLCTVSDIIFANNEIFTAHTSATCAYNTRVYDPTP